MRFAAIVLLAALPAVAQSPSTFRSSAEVTPAGPDALHAIEMPFEAYRDARKDLGDIRIFNAGGDAVPYAWAADPGRIVQEAQPIPLPIFPIVTVPVAGQASTEVTVRAADGTLVSVRGARKLPSAFPGEAKKPPSPLGEGRGEGPNRSTGVVGRPAA